MVCVVRRMDKTFWERCPIGTRFTLSTIFDSIYQFSSVRDSTSLYSILEDVLRTFQAARSIRHRRMERQRPQSWPHLLDTMPTDS